jgi:hypothetical protein
MQLRHICEVCGRDEVLDCDAAYRLGWDYPPRMGRFGVVSPRTCPHCAVGTVWWAMVVEGYVPQMLSVEQRETITRILAEPLSIRPLAS